MISNYLYPRIQDHAIFDDEYQKRYDLHSFNGILIGTYTLLNSVVLNDLEWLSKIYSDKKRRTVSQWQLSLFINIVKW